MIHDQKSSRRSHISETNSKDVFLTMLKARHHGAENWAEYIWRGSIHQKCQICKEARRIVQRKVCFEQETCSSHSLMSVQLLGELQMMRWEQLYQTTQWISRSQWNYYWRIQQFNKNLNSELQQKKIKINPQKIKKELDPIKDWLLLKCFHSLKFVPPLHADLAVFNLLIATFNTQMQRSKITWIRFFQAEAYPQKCPKGPIFNTMKQLYCLSFSQKYWRFLRNYSIN